MPGIKLDTPLTCFHLILCSSSRLSVMSPNETLETQIVVIQLLRVSSKARLDPGLTPKPVA